MDQHVQRWLFDPTRLGFPLGTNSSDYTEKLEAMELLMGNKDVRGGCELIYQLLISFLHKMSEVASSVDPLVWPVEMDATEFARLIQLLVAVAIGMNDDRGGIDSDMTALALAEMPQMGEALTVLQELIRNEDCPDAERRKFYFRSLHPLAMKLLVYLARIRCE